MNPELANIVVKLTKLGSDTKRFTLEVIVDQLIDHGKVR